MIRKKEKKRKSMGINPNPILINKDGFRKDLDDYFKKYMFTYKKQISPFIAIDRNNRMVSCLRYTKYLFEIPDSTVILHTWPGKWKSDVFIFNIKEMKEWLSNQPEEYQNTINKFYIRGIK